MPMGDHMKDFGSQAKSVGGNEGGKCHYPTRLDTYGCGCAHDCSYCYAKSLLDFRDLWNPADPSIGDIAAISRQIRTMPREVVKLSDIYKRYNNGKSKYFNSMILDDDLVAPTVTSGGENFRFCDKKKCSDQDYRNIQTFPQDYDFCGNPVKYVCGMSVPPNMMANIATEVYEQWLR